MRNEPAHDFAMERRLRELDPQLHRRFTDAVFALQYNLSHYKLIFPEFTDHTNLHSLTVIDFCNRLIGEQIDLLNADEMYVLLMACYFHDTGMGITLADYMAFSEEINFGSYFDSHPKDNYPGTIRDFHHEFSGRFIRKYAELFEIPSDEHLRAIVQVSRGHRKTNLLDEREYPLAFRMQGGNTICMPYLAALIRLADEIDVASNRNPSLLYDFDIESLKSEKNIIENKKLQAVHRLEISESTFTVVADLSDPSTAEALRKMILKMQKTLDDCRAAVNGRTPYILSQSQVLLR